MALKTLLLRNKLDLKKKALTDLRAKDADFEKREAELEASINEMTEETPAEDREVVEGAVDEFNTEHEQHETDKKALEEEIRGIEEEIEIMGGDENEYAWTEEGDETDGAKWWSLEFSDCWRFSKVYLRAMEVA